MYFKNIPDNRKHIYLYHEIITFAFYKVLYKKTSCKITIGYLQVINQTKPQKTFSLFY